MNFPLSQASLCHEGSNQCAYCWITLLSNQDKIPVFFPAYHWKEEFLMSSWQDYSNVNAIPILQSSIFHNVPNLDTYLGLFFHLEEIWHMKQRCGSNWNWFQTEQGPKKNQHVPNIFSRRNLVYGKFVKSRPSFSLIKVNHSGL